MAFTPVLDYPTSMVPSEQQIMMLSPQSETHPVLPWWSPTSSVTLTQQVDSVANAQKTRQEQGEYGQLFTSSFLPSTNVLTTRSTYCCCTAAVASIFFELGDFSSTLQWDKVIRVRDDDQPPVIKLERTGLVSLWGVQYAKRYDSSTSSSNISSPIRIDANTCRSTGSSALFITPTAKLQQLLPPQTNVAIVVIPPAETPPRRTNEYRTRPPKALIFVEEKGSYKMRKGNVNNNERLPDQKHSLTSIQGELIQRGYARINRKAISAMEKLVPGLVEEWEILQQQAEREHRGPLHPLCGAVTPTFLETDWSDEKEYAGTATTDTPSNASPKLPNPGDTKACSDFETYEDALRWYERYWPYYGDVAKLDRDDDGVPCPGLPHTKNRDLYRMKVPRRT